MIQYSLNSPLPGWTVQNLTATSGTGLTIAGDLAFNRLWFPHLFATDASGNLIEYACSGGTWSASNITAGISSPFTMMGPLTVGAIGGASRHVYGHDTRNHLIRYNWSGGAWSAEDLNVSAGSGERVMGSASAISGPDSKHHLFVRNTTGDVVHFHRNYYGVWTSTNLTTAPGAGFRVQSELLPIIGPSPRPRETLHVFARHAGGNLLHYFFDYERADGVVAQILRDASTVLRVADSTIDVECNVTLVRNGPVSTFSVGDGIITTGDELEEAMDSRGNVAVVNVLMWCDGFDATVIGCGETPGESFVVEADTGNADIVWTHEYGHNKGLNHRNAPDAVMNGTLAANRREVNQNECDAYED